MRILSIILLITCFMLGCKQQPRKTEGYEKKEDQVEKAPQKEVADLQVERDETNCLDPEDEAFVEEEIKTIVREIQTNDGAIGKERLAEQYKNLVGEEMHELQHQVASFFDTSLMTNEYKSEAKTEHRFIPTSDLNCLKYAVIQNFPQSEFTYTFILVKSGARLVFEEVQIIG